MSETRLRKNEMLAQGLAFELMQGGACSGQATVWVQKEAEHAAASTKEQARAAAAPLVQLCAQCPMVQQCGTWATVDRYTGIAAGFAWKNGRLRDIDFVPYRQRRGKNKSGEAPASPAVENLVKASA